MQLFKKLAHVKAGDPITADLFNALAERLEAFSTLKSGSRYVRIWDTPYGKSIALALPQTTWALLSGSTSPYSFTEVRDGPGGTWVSMPNGDSGQAYEINGKSGLNGKVVEVHWTSASDWRFQWVGQGLPAWTFNISGCTGALAGATVELYQSGVLIDSCVTADGTGGTTLGRCVLNVPAGTYDVVINGPSGAGFATTTLTGQTISAAKTTSATLTVGSGHACWTCCNFPIPDTIYVTDAFGTHAMPKTIVGGLPTYSVLFDVTVSESCDPNLLSPNNCVNCHSPGSTPWGYGLRLNNNCTATVWLGGAYAMCTVLGVQNWHFHDGSITAGNAFTDNIGNFAISSGNCQPFNLVVNVPTIIPHTVAQTMPLSTPGGGGPTAFTA